jgi:E3 SUMO-protein ligase PIAS1
MPRLPRSLVIQEAVNANDPVRLQQIRQSVHNTISSSHTSSSPSRTTLPHSHGHAPSAPYGLPSMSFPNPHGSLSNGQRFGGSQAVTLAFKSSPFYQIEAHVGDVKVCDGKSYAFFCHLGSHTDLVKSCRSTVTQ